MPALNEEREDVSLCIVKDRFLYAFGSVTTRGKRFKPNKITSKISTPQRHFRGFEYTFERIDPFGAEAREWETVAVKTTFQDVERLPTMKHMGCFNHYVDNTKIIIFGGGAGSSLSDKCFCIDVEAGTISKHSKLAKQDRFPNHIYFKKDDKLFVFGEFYLHMFNITKQKWVKDPIPLN